MHSGTRSTRFPTRRPLPQNLAGGQSAQERGFKSALERVRPLWRETSLDRSWHTYEKNQTERSVRDHIVPLTPDLIELLESIPRFDGGYVFSNCDGKKALADYVGVKES